MSSDITFTYSNFTILKESLNEALTKIKQLEAVKKYTECWEDYQKQFAELTLKNGKLIEENSKLEKQRDNWVDKSHQLYSENQRLREDINEIMGLSAKVLYSYKSEKELRQALHDILKIAQKTLEDK